MDNATKLHSTNPLIAELTTKIAAIVDEEVRKLDGVSYMEVVGALEIIKADYILGFQAVNLME